MVINIHFIRDCIGNHSLENRPPPRHPRLGYIANQIAFSFSARAEKRKMKQVSSARKQKNYYKNSFKSF
jgi:hypothetical protein